MHVAFFCASLFHYLVSDSCPDLSRLLILEKTAYFPLDRMTAHFLPAGQSPIPEREHHFDQL
jgi:hypothetical protein